MWNQIVDSNLTPLIFGAVFGATTALRTVLLRRTDGVNAYVIDHSDPMHRLVGQVFLAVIVGLVGCFSLLAFEPDMERLLGNLPWVARDPARWISVVLMVFATLWTGYAQYSMGNSWRIGIPQGDVPPLRLNGPFRVSRNPIFLGMLLFVLAMVLWSPNVVTVALAAAAYISLEVQIRGEETFLESAHGDAYRMYCSRVRRWL